MMCKLSEGHPYFFVRSCMSRYERCIEAFYFSKYQYEPRAIVDQRVVFECPFVDFMDGRKIDYFIEDLSASEELAFHSIVKLKDGSYEHIPMVDMQTSASSQLKKTDRIIEEYAQERFQWFSSGRSFHGYGERLISGERWIKVLGFLLLMNQKEFVDKVDPRWVGHRLMAGYSALRWSRNTARSLSYPLKINS